MDVTNYVMLELGRPLHVYDLDKVSGGIDVRFGPLGRAASSCSTSRSSSSSPTCWPSPTLRADRPGRHHGRGQHQSGPADARNVFLEAAFFFPDAIAGRARRYNFASDASHRFERGVDFDNNVAGIERATQLILDICGGEPGPVVDTIARLPERMPVRMRVRARAANHGRADPAPTRWRGFSPDLGCSHGARATASGNFVVTPPSYRFDLEIEEDLIEEVARVYGFENIPAQPTAGGCE